MFLTKWKLRNKVTVPSNNGRRVRDDDCNHHHGRNNNNNNTAVSYGGSSSSSEANPWIDDNNDDARQRSLTRSFHRNVQTPHYQLQQRAVTSATKGRQQQKQKQQRIGVQPYPTFEEARRSRDPRHDDHDHRQNHRREQLLEKERNKENIPPPFMRRSMSFEDRRHNRSRPLYQIYNDDHDAGSSPSDEKGGKYMEREEVEEDESIFNQPLDVSGLTHESDFDATIKKGNKSKRGRGMNKSTDNHSNKRRSQSQSQGRTIREKLRGAALLSGGVRKKDDNEVTRDHKILSPKKDEKHHLSRHRSHSRSKEEERRSRDLSHQRVEVHKMTPKQSQPVQQDTAIECRIGHGLSSRDEKGRSKWREDWKPPKRSPREPSPSFDTSQLATISSTTFQSSPNLSGGKNSLPFVSPEPTGMRLDALDGESPPLLNFSGPLQPMSASSSSFPINHHPSNHPSPRVEPVGRRLDVDFLHNQSNTAVSRLRPVTESLLDDHEMSFANFSEMPREQHKKEPFPLPVARTRSRSLNRSCHRIENDPKQNKPVKKEKRAKSLPRQRLHESYSSYDWSAKGYQLQDNVVISYGGRVKWPSPVSKPSIGADKSASAKPTVVPKERCEPEVDPFRDSSDFRGVEIMTISKRSTPRRLEAMSSLSNSKDPSLVSPLSMASFSDVTEEVDALQHQNTTCFLQKKTQYINGFLSHGEESAESETFQHNNSQDIIHVRTKRTEYTMQAQGGSKKPASRPPRSSKTKASQIRMVTKEASKKSLLAPFDKDDSSLVEEDLIDGLGSGREARKKDSCAFVDCVAVTPTPKPSSSLSTRTISAAVVTPPPPASSDDIVKPTKAISLTPAERKKLISKYLSMRNDGIKKSSLRKNTSDPPPTFTSPYISSEASNRFNHQTSDAFSSSFLVKSSIDHDIWHPPAESSAALSSLTTRSSDPSIVGSSNVSPSTSTSGSTISDWSHSVLTDERDDVPVKTSAQSPPTACVVRHLDLEEDDQLPNLTVESSGSCIMLHQNRDHDVSTRDRSKSCLPSCGLSRMRMKKKMKAGGYMNMSLNESSNSLVRGKTYRKTQINVTPKTEYPSSEEGRDNHHIFGYLSPAVQGSSVGFGQEQLEI